MITLYGARKWIQARTSSEFQEHYQNSLMGAAVETVEIKCKEKPVEKGTLLSGSEFREHSRESRMNTCVKITEYEDLKEIRLPLKPK